MKLVLRSIAVLLATATAAITPSLAQTAGQQVVDTSGTAVGTVLRIEGSNLVVKTDKHEVALPKTSFTESEGKLLFGMTQAQLNAEVEKAQAEAAKSIAPGATVKGSDGSVAGTISSVDSESVTVKLSSGALVRVPRTGVAAGNGEVVVGLTAAELQAAAVTGPGSEAAAADKPEAKAKRK